MFSLKICQFLSFFLLTMVSRHCKLDLLHSLMLPPKGPALHIHLNNLKTTKITKKTITKRQLQRQRQLKISCHMLPSKAPALHIHLNNLKYSST